MIGRIVIAVCLFAATAMAKERPGWIDKVPPHRPGDFPELRRVELDYRFGWSGFLAGRATVSFLPDKNGELYAGAEGGTTGVVRALWQLDATHQARGDRVAKLPFAYEQREQYRSYRIDTGAAFAREAASVLREKIPGYGEVFKRKTIKLPDAMDLHAGYRYVRSQRMEAGDRYSFIAVASDSAFLATVKVVKREKIKVGGVARPAIRCELQVRKVDKKRELIPYRKFKRATGWLSDDADRIPLRIEADIFVGKVWVELGK
jgi:hypothetical protein